MNAIMLFRTVHLIILVHAGSFESRREFFNKWWVLSVYERFVSLGELMNLIHLISQTFL